MRERNSANPLVRSLVVHPPPPPLIIEQVHYIPVHTNMPMVTRQWSRIACYVYWLADGRRDYSAIARLLNKSPVIIVSHLAALERAGFVVVEPQRRVLRMRIDLLESSLEAVKVHGDQFAITFYENLFAISPTAKDLFAKTDIHRQARTLMSTINSVVAGVKAQVNLLPTLHQLGERHATRYGVRPEHYPIVGATLIGTFSQYLGPQFTQEHADAWNEAFAIISHHMVSYNE